MRIRTIKPEFWESESVGRLSRDARLLFIGLWSIAEDSGVSRASLARIRAGLFPYDETLKNSQIESWLNELEKESMIKRYCVGADHYLHVCNWQKHQKIDHPGKLRLPLPTDPLATVSRESRDGLATDQGSGIRDQGKDQGPIAAPEKPPPARARDPLFDALAESTEGVPVGGRATNGGQIAAALKAIREAHPDVTPEEIRRRASEYRLALPEGTTLSSSALSKHWHRCDGTHRRTANGSGRLQSIDHVEASLQRQRERWKQQLAEEEKVG